jgi:hypothetical protein
MNGKDWLPALAALTAVALLLLAGCAGYAPPGAAAPSKALMARPMPGHPCPDMAEAQAEWERIRQCLIELSKESVKNAEAYDQIAHNLLQGWPEVAGAAEKYLGSRRDELPAKVLAAFDGLDALYAKSLSAEGLTKRELGHVGGYFLLLIDESVRAVLQQVAPEVLEKLLALLPH